MKKLEHLLEILAPYQPDNMNMYPLGMMMYKNKKTQELEWACDIQIEGPVEISVSGTGSSFSAAVRAATREFESSKTEIDKRGTTHSQRATRP